MTDGHDALALLQRAVWLGPGRAALAEALVAQGRIVRLPAGRWAQAEGDEEAGLLVVLSGSVQLFGRGPGDRELLLGQLGRGAMLGQPGVQGGGPRLLTVICQEDSTFLRVPDRALTRVAAEHPEIWEAIVDFLYQQIRGLLQLLAEATALPPRQRVAARLAALARGQPTDVPLRLSQQSLGEMVGLSRKTVNAHLGLLERTGFIRRGYGELTVLDAAGLRRLSER